MPAPPAVSPTPTPRNIRYIADIGSDPAASGGIGAAWADPFQPREPSLQSTSEVLFATCVSPFYFVALSFCVRPAT
jgi:hypothetical protein